MTLFGFQSVCNIASEGHIEKEIEEQLQIESDHQIFKKTVISKHMGFAKLCANLWHKKRYHLFVLTFNF